MRRVATRRYVFAHREASRFHRISRTHSTRSTRIPRGVEGAFSRPRRRFRRRASLLGPGGRRRALINVGCLIQDRDIVIPILHVITSTRPKGSVSPLKRRRVAEQRGVYHPRKLGTLDAELDGCDDRLSAGEEWPPVYEDARATFRVERVGEAGALHPVLDNELEGGRSVLREIVARWGRWILVDRDYPIEHIGGRRQRGVVWHLGRQVHDDDKGSPFLRD